MRLTWTGALLAVACSVRAAPSDDKDAGGPRRELVFTGMCDASGAVPLSETLFAVADDEDNVLRVFDATRGGPPVWSVDVSDRLGLPVRPRKNPNKPPKSPPETDIEAATRVGDLAFWITSHGRNSAGKLKPERLRLFATTVPNQPSGIKVVGTPYEGLLADLIADPRFAKFKLAEAAELAPKEPGGLNIEGLTDRAEGGVFIGFRNPTPAGKALLVVLSNPKGVIRGKPARLGDPVLLELGGLGVRALSSWRGRYLIVAGHYSDGAPSRLFIWDGQSKPERLENAESERLNPEGFFTPEALDDVMLLSDDGGVAIDGTDCKRLKDQDRKRFRGRWITLPPTKR